MYINKLFTKIIPFMVFCVSLFALNAVSGLAEQMPAKPASVAKLAATMPTPVIALCDVEYIMNESLSAKNVRQGVEKQAGSWSSDFVKRQQELESAVQALVKQRGSLSAEAYNAKERELYNKRNNFLQDQEVKRRQLEKGFQQSISPVQDQMLEIIKQVMQEKKINLTIQRSLTVIADPQFDITEDVLGRLDSAMPKTDFKLPPPESLPDVQPSILGADNNLKPSAKSP